MPLKPGSGQKTVSRNIGELHHGETYRRTRRKFGAKKAHRQAIAIALSHARKYEGVDRETVPNEFHSTVSDFIDLCASHGLDPSSAEAERIAEEVEELLWAETPPEEIARRYHLPVDKVRQALGVREAITQEADQRLETP
jgi:hypothetical protein